MKKIIIILMMLLCSIGTAFANDYYSGGVSFDWINLSQKDRNSIIAEYKNKAFQDSPTTYSKNEFRDKYSKYTKDARYKTHYYAINNGDVRDDVIGADICAFSFINLHYAYAIKYDNNSENVFYYDMLGRLIYVDEISGAVACQYNSWGALDDVVYYVSKDDQFVFGADRKFMGRWYKDKLYNAMGHSYGKRNNW